MARFDLEEKNWVDSDGTRDLGKNLGDSEEQGSDYQLLRTWIARERKIAELEEFGGRTRQEQQELEE